VIGALVVDYHLVALVVDYHWVALVVIAIGLRSMRRQRVAYGRPSVEKLPGALPVVAEYCRRLDLAAIIDRVCPVRDLAILSRGQVKILLS
jgi:ribosomal protein L30E